MRRRRVVNDDVAAVDGDARFLVLNESLRRRKE